VERDDLVSAARQAAVHTPKLVNCGTNDTGTDAIVRHAEQQPLVIQVCAILVVSTLNADSQG
jgi:hypothetical protein